MLPRLLSKYLQAEKSNKLPESLYGSSGGASTELQKTREFRLAKLLKDLPESDNHCTLGSIAS